MPKLLIQVTVRIVPNLIPQDYDRKSLLDLFGSLILEPINGLKIPFLLFCVWFNLGYRLLFLEGMGFSWLGILLQAKRENDNRSYDADKLYLGPTSLMHKGGERGGL